MLGSLRKCGKKFMNKLDYKKAYKDIYIPKKIPAIIDIPPIQYVIVEGQGDPNTSFEYQEAIELLYGLSFTIKMSKMTDHVPQGYFEYVVPPLEGLWWCDDCNFDGLHINDKGRLHWKSMIRLPEFVDIHIFEQAKQQLKVKKPELHVDKLHYEVIEEGLCVQIMHIGSYDSEAKSILKMNQFIKDNGLQLDVNKERLHHEIYLSDPRRTKTENLKTVIRHPVKKI